MTWGKELWDQFDLIANHTNVGIDFVEKVSKFVKERCEIESRYAKDLRKLVKSFLPKKKEEEEQVFSSQKAFTGVVKETDDLAGQHELIAESLTERIYKELHLLHNELKTERRKHLNEGKKVQDALEQSMRVLEASKKSFMKASEEADTAFQAFQKADQDMANSRLQIEKFKNVSMEKGQACEKAKEEYRNQLEQTNSKQALHFSNEMPAVFDDLQKMNEHRIQRTGELITEYSNVETKIMPIIQKCLDNIRDNGKSVNGAEDSKILIEQNKTAYEPPRDIQFEENGKSQTLNRQPQSVEKLRKPKKSGWFGPSKKIKKPQGESGLDGNDQTLTPGQKIRTSKKKVQQLDAQVAQLKNSREGMEKMIDVYRQNPSLGDPNTIEQQLSENAKELDALNADLYKYKCYLAVLEKKDAPPPPEMYSKVTKARPPAAPGSDNSDGSPPPPSPAPSTPVPPPPPGMLVPPVEEPDDEWGEDDEDEFQCKVIYDFQASNDGELSVNEGDLLVILEQDLDNSGWTKVLKDEDEGYVPSSYIELL